MSTQISCGHCAVFIFGQEREETERLCTNQENPPPSPAVSKSGSDDPDCFDCCILYDNIKRLGDTVLIF